MLHAHTSTRVPNLTNVAALRPRWSPSTTAHILNAQHLIFLTMDLEDYPGLKCHLKLFSPSGPKLFKAKLLNAVTVLAGGD